MKWPQNTSRFIGAAVLLLMLSTCAERPRNNPFEPGGDSPLLMTLAPLGAQVEVSWALERAISGLDGFRIYRATDSSAFMQLTETPPGSRRFVDSDIVFGRRYRYRVTAFGDGQETAPSNVRGTLPGPGTFWALGADEYVLKKFSYDLQYLLASYDLFNPPEEWALSLGDAQDPLIWICFARFSKGITSINPLTGDQQYFFRDAFSYPADVDYDPTGKNLYILDNRRSRVFIFRDGDIREEVVLDSTDTYHRIRYLEGSGGLLISGEAQLLHLLGSGSNWITEVFRFEAPHSGKDFEFVADRAYVLTTADAAGSSILYVFSADFRLQSTLRLTAPYYRIALAADARSYFLAEGVVGGDDRIVQLSPDGGRLMEIAGFRTIEQICIHPVDSSIAVVDSDDDMLKLFDHQGNLISESRDPDGFRLIFRPIRIFVE